TRSKRDWSSDVCSSDFKVRDDELKELANGIELEDGPVQAQHVDRLNNENGFVLSIYEGRNRLVRRMVEYFGTQATKLKRVDYAGLNLDNVRMGRWRYLRKNEINALRKLVKLEPLDFNKGGS